MPTVVIDVLTSVMVKGITSDLSGITLSTVSSELGGTTGKFSLSPTGHFPQPGLLGKLGSLQGQVSMTARRSVGWDLLSLNGHLLHSQVYSVL